ncbi:MAG: malonyl-ACP O-methyltransferase BioC [Phycisphaerae bacterium]|nr:malonyl-ACP O-methyltransferase BioC [Phycisphaerae bacterium]
MKYNWINKLNNDHLLVFFNGWAMDGEPFAHLAAVDLDVLEISDYTSAILELDLCEIAQQYRKTILVAWSLGVWAAAELCDKLDFKPDFAIAINGTLNPISDKFGIAPDIFQATIDNLDEASLNNFNRRMCKTKDNFNFFNANKPGRNISDQKQELENLQDRILNNNFNDSNLFDLAIIAKQDRIMPTANQLNFWQTKSVKTIELDKPHYCFAKIKFWQQLANPNYFSPKPDKKLIAQRFTRSLKTYPANASVQLDIAKTLIREMTKITDNIFDIIIEVGCGTGLLTKQIEKKIVYEKLYLNDIVSQCHVLADQIDNSSFIPGDIEKIDSIHNKLDLVISSSTFQWLHNLDDAFKKFARWLSPDGILAFSTFGPDNLNEIAQLTGLALDYPAVDELKAILGKNFNVLTCYEKHHYCKFENPSDVLKHLKQTGVTSLSNVQWTRNDLKNFNEAYIQKFTQNDGVILTYHPIVVIASVK